MKAIIFLLSFIAATCNAHIIPVQRDQVTGVSDGEIIITKLTEATVMSSIEVQPRKEIYKNDEPTSTPATTTHPTTEFFVTTPTTSNTDPSTTITTSTTTTTSAGTATGTSTGTSTATSASSSASHTWNPGMGSNGYNLTCNRTD
ncbi:hypothetical protein F4778DRAFT_724289 [Xylariomycetidae sp. FL2044]|nr:hypothetical protein F4778DRAFT_724289 [Xylariomycetidae sp. FL2044]